MIRQLSHKKMGRSDLGWLQSLFHFSFAEYHNPDNINFGMLRVINDDLVHPSKGFDFHPHQNMEIVSYVVDGELSHKDSMGNEHTLTRGQVQYMSAGTGVIHSEHNLGKDMLRFLQIWIIPDARGHKPRYGDVRFSWDDRINKWLHIVSPEGGPAKINIHQDFNIHVTTLDKGKEASFDVKKGRQAYVVQIEGRSDINGVKMDTRDGLESVEEPLKIKATEDAHIMVLEMAKP